MEKLSRKEFLRLAAAGMSAIAIEGVLSGCEQPKAPPVSQATQARSLEPTPTSRPQPTGTSSNSQKNLTSTPESTAQVSTDTPAAAVSEASPTSPGAPYLVVARGGEPEEMVRRALKALGGMEKFVHSGDEVIVKPNICTAVWTYEHAATTNPWVVGALVRLCLEAGARRVRVMDYPFQGTQDEAFKRSGIQEQVIAAGGEMAYMPGYKYKDVIIANAKSLKKCSINDDVLKADVLINVPIAKHHNSAKLTLGMKNLMGVIRDRGAMHIDLGQRIADLAAHLRPALTVIDAVRILTANGPTGGDLKDVKKLDTVIASPDIVAADSFAATLFGKKPEDIPYITAGAALGLGKSDLNSFKIEEIQVGA